MLNFVFQEQHVVAESVDFYFAFICFTLPCLRILFQGAETPSLNAHIILTHASNSVLFSIPLSELAYCFICIVEGVNRVCFSMYVCMICYNRTCAS